MNLAAFKASLARHPEKDVRFVLPDGDAIPARFHVTEVGHVVKTFIDCGGTVRSTESCLLQSWVPAGDGNHRLAAGKLAHILDLSRKVVPSGELPVELEYGGGVVAQYTIDVFAADDTAITFTLGNKQTDCLAREACGIEDQGCGCAPAGAGTCC